VLCVLRRAPRRHNFDSPTAVRRPPARNLGRAAAGAPTRGQCCRGPPRRRLLRHVALRLRLGEQQLLSRRTLLSLRPPHLLLFGLSTTIIIIIIVALPQLPTPLTPRLWSSLLVVDAWWRRLRHRERATGHHVASPPAPAPPLAFHQLQLPALCLLPVRKESRHHSRLVVQSATLRKGVFIIFPHFPCGARHVPSTLLRVRCGLQHAPQAFGTTNYEYGGRHVEFNGGRPAGGRR
jgi:hypothetical protein